jgi:hypothetical protein
MTLGDREQRVGGGEPFRELPVDRRRQPAVAAVLPIDVPPGLQLETETDLEVQLELIHRNDDDSHDVVLMIGEKEKSKFILREDDVEYLHGGIQLKQPSVKIVVDNVSAAKFRGFTKGNIPTPDIPSDSLP